MESIGHNQNFDQKSRKFFFIGVDFFLWLINVRIFASVGIHTKDRNF